ncbi:hypothetical protein B296_00050633 [Ensete ventricosum]|uniref:Uncharacterized protein n=1 Tax=Ensete ventricosum TaxID=4639 RepID=A0A426XPJ2_ENSVE|nr:hypothetical protein B296_00050633 [Ensete ventricosum]
MPGVHPAIPAFYVSTPGFTARYGDHPMEAGAFPRDDHLGAALPPPPSSSSSSPPFRPSALVSTVLSLPPAA